MSVCRGDRECRGVRTPLYYVLDTDGRTPIPVDLFTWAHSFERRDGAVDPWRVGETLWEDGARLSTAFLGLDHQWGDGGPPLLFESMLFGVDEEWMLRCSTWEQALVMHRLGVLDAVECHGQPIASMLVGVL